MLLIFNISCGKISGISSPFWVLYHNLSSEDQPTDVRPMSKEERPEIFFYTTCVLAIPSTDCRYCFTQAYYFFVKLEVVRGEIRVGEKSCTIDLDTTPQTFYYIEAVVTTDRWAAWILEAQETAWPLQQHQSNIAIPDKPIQGGGCQLNPSLREA